MWKALEAPRGRAAFRVARQERDDLSRFEDAESLVAFLNDPAADRDERDRIYRTLVTCFQGFRAFSGEAFALLWLGLQPGLDHAYRKERRVCRAGVRKRLQTNGREPIGDEYADVDPAQSFFDTFIEAVVKLDLTGVHRIAATLVLGTARDVQRTRRGWEDPRFVPIPEDDDDENVPEVLRVRPLEYSELGLPPTRTDEDEQQAVSALIREADPKAAEIVIEMVLGGGDPKVIAERLKVTPHAVRKRVHAALDRVGQNLRRRERFGLKPIRSKE